MDNINTADQRELPILGNFKSVIDTKVTMKNCYVKKSSSRLAHFEKSVIFVIRVNHLPYHPCCFMGLP